MSNQDLKAQPKTPHAASTEEATKAENYFSPLVDIFETPEAVIVIADVPGVSQENVEISLDDNILTIHGKMTDQQPVGRVILEEYESGHYMRKFTVAETIDREKIEASLAGGVLKVMLPKQVPVQPKKIEVKMG
ncbi:Hsp20/alpha crystallin family protein [Desulfogranum marinum]|jgi:HSP20 family protein|uniref:Hsp20/alpha crystallin family protein n=1 Tax=Desulfogranum marinum TaxID=453220 RepID=UPI0019666E31|nr:Hsp20/alpha crystallin family protein [Desulfogranum marinum]MBM9513445.1 Hsp20/alpha crystallin family protein [Desulfogranum marinum]